jgi:hypothetical protein
METKHIRCVAGDGRSCALLSTDPETDTAVAFVHGFRGHFEKTWQQFQSLMDEADRHATWRRSDLYFFSYDAENSHIGASASELATFLASHYPNPPHRMFEYPAAALDWADGTLLRLGIIKIRPGPYFYSRLKLVGHSLGAVIIRQLVADQVEALANLGLPREDSQAIRSTHPAAGADVFLFAPAHLGFLPSGITGAAVSAAHETMFGRMLMALAKGYRAYAHLQPGSAALSSLRRRTESLAVSHPQIGALKPRILWGKQEGVVIVGRFDCDPGDAEFFIDNRGHVDICKPTADFVEPFSFIEAEVGAYVAKR